MPKIDLSSKTVSELRKMAKEYGVTLGAGIQKAGIVAKLEAALMDDEEEPQTSPAPEAEVVETVDAAPAEQPAQADEEKADEEEVPAQPEEKPASAAQPQPVQYRAAWPNPTPRYSSKPAYTTARPNAWQGDTRAMGQDTPPRQGTVRPAGFTPRFGPEAAESPRAEEDYRYRAPEPPRAPYPERRPAAYGDSAYPQSRPAYDQRPAYGQHTDYPQPREPYAPAFEQRAPYPAYDAGAYSQRPPYAAGKPAAPYAARRSNTGYYNAELGTSNPAVSEMLAAGECADGSGVLELHPDGYGFLRSDNFLPSSKDIYVSMAQIKRFGLRTGDKVTGKTRPQRDGDKYTAMLYITDINGVAPDDMGQRPNFDELTPMYPTRRISLESKTDKMPAMRVADLVSPLGFGQRGLVLCPPDCGKADVLRDFANVIAANYPEATVMVLLVDECPEDVTLFRDQAHCQVLASTFDLAPESHLRLADMVLERAERLVEQKQDVVIVVDSLTRLAKTFTTAAAQQGRSMPGMVNPSSLFRAKKLFGAARCLKEGGSLTVIGAMNIDNGSKVDDTVVEEFKGTANMELILDASLSRAGLTPPINVQLSGTRRMELLLDAQQLEGVKLLRSVLAGMSPAQALQQLNSLLDKTAQNNEMLLKLKDWIALMKDGRTVSARE